MVEVIAIVAIAVAVGGGFGMFWAYRKGFAEGMKATKGIAPVQPIMPHIPSKDEKARLEEVKKKAEESKKTFDKMDEFRRTGGLGV